MTTPLDQAARDRNVDHAAKRVLVIMIVGFLLIAVVAPWAGQ